MTRYEIEIEIEKQEADLEIALGCDEETACHVFGSDSKAEAVEAISKELDFYRGLLSPEPVYVYERTSDTPCLSW